MSTSVPIISQVTSELQVTFNPPLYLQRRAWVFSIMRREKVKQVLDVGCGEGELVQCLCHPSPWLKVPTNDPTILIPEPDDFIHLEVIHALDISHKDLQYVIEGTKPLRKPLSQWDQTIRWESLNVNVWEGALESFNPEFVGIECIVSTEVVEHITPEILPDFASMLLGVYQPRLFLITTPSYTFNARFTPPNAPPSARSGYPDPTKRTDRIFRHHDHKFEWTVDEFQEYCRGVADEWGYEVETSGVGTAQEVDEWGRDEDLGFASQVAIFRRREEDQYSCTRTKKSQEYIEKVKGRKVHQLLAAHQHAAHPDAKRPVSLEEIGEQVRKIMEEFQEAIMTLRELWFMREISTACGGQVELLGEAIERHNDLKCRRTNDGIWEVHWLGYKPEFKSVPIDDEKSQATNTVWRDDASTRPESKGWDWEENEANIQTDWGASWGSSSTEVDGWGDTQVVEVART